MPSSNVTTTCDRPNFEIERIVLQTGQAADRLLDQKRDLLLDFFGPERGRDRVDLHLHRRGVWKGVDVQVSQRGPADDCRHAQRTRSPRSDAAAKSR